MPLDILKELNLLKLQKCENKFKILDLARLFGWQQQNKTSLGYRQKLGFCAQGQNHIFALAIALTKLSCTSGETLICCYFAWFEFDDFHISFIRGNCYYVNT